MKKTNYIIKMDFVLYNDVAACCVSVQHEQYDPVVDTFSFVPLSFEHGVQVVPVLSSESMQIH